MRFASSLRRAAVSALPILLAVAGCAAPAPPDGPAVGGRRLQIQDLQVIERELLEDVAAAIESAARATPPVVVAGRFTVRTVAGDDSAERVATNLPGRLAAAAPSHGLRVLLDVEDGAPSGPEIDYVLSGSLFRIAPESSSTLLLDCRLVQWRDGVDGPGAGRGAIVWEGLYEVNSP